MSILPMATAESVSPNPRTSANRTAGEPRRVALISLRFKPAFVSHMIAFAKACNALGYAVEYLVDPAYADFADLVAVAPLRAYRGSLSLNGYTHAIVMNVSPAHETLVAKLKLFGTRVIYLYHEPRERLVDGIRTEGIVRELKLTLAYLLSIRMLKAADAVIVPSQYGMKVYEKRDFRYNGTPHRIPLLFDDESSTLPGQQQRRYFSYIGAICRSHGFDMFLSFARYCLENELPIQFLIASADPMPEHDSCDQLIQRSPHKFKIQCGRPLQTDEINVCFRESICVWNLYRRSTQSGVLPKCFMFGTPVLATDTGAFSEFVQDGVNGKFVAAENPGAIYAAYFEIQSRFQEYSFNARNAFLNTFYFGSQLENLRRVLLTGTSY